MKRQLPRDLMAFARKSGFEATPCPSCHVRALESAGSSSTCTNCGGSGRIWKSLRGSLADEGLLRLHHLVSRNSWPFEGRS